MKHKTLNIGISCIGSGVGQSVINSLRLSRLPLKTIGLGTNPFAYGAYDCDVYDYTLSIYDDGFIDNLIQKCKEHEVELIIPGHDDEALIYAKHISKFEQAGIKALVAGEELISICRDKERMSEELNQIAKVFVRSYNKQSFAAALASGILTYPFIAKPRSGFASRGVEIIRCEADLHKITDSHIVQELAIPSKLDPNYSFYMAEIDKNRNPQVSEVSIQLVYSPQGQLMGRMFSYNKLNNGVPIEIVPYDNTYIWSIVDELIPRLLQMGLRGPLNIQGRLTDQGLKLFEMNPRFTGITGLRALMGFNEVEACVKEWLGIDCGNNKLQINYNRFGVRQTADKSIPLERNQRISQLARQINNGEIKKQKTLLVTGACGYLGQNLINRLLESSDFEIWIFDIDKLKINYLFGNKTTMLFDKDDLLQGRLQLGKIDILLHLGFARPYGTNMQIAESLSFTLDLFNRAAAHQVPVIINISSQSVYGSATPPWHESTPPSPQTVYGQAKYASELFLQALGETNKTLKFCSVRLGTLAGGAGGLVEVDFLSKISRKALAAHPIRIVGGDQLMERLDIRDAVSAIITLLRSRPERWKPVYNVGPGKALSLMEITLRAVQLAKQYNGGQSSEITIGDNQARRPKGMDSGLFYMELDWRPQYSTDDSILSLLDYFRQHYQTSQSNQE